MEELDLQENKLENIDENIFASQTKLKLLHLDDNRLTTLPEHIFRKQTTLRRNIFERETDLGILILSNNQITSLPVNTFEHTSILWELYLDGNKLKILPRNIFLNEAGSNIYLDCNPWLYDHDAQQFVQKYNVHNRIISCADKKASASSYGKIPIIFAFIWMVSVSILMNSL